MGRQKSASFADRVVVILMDATVLFLLLWANERLFQEEHALHNGRQNTDSCYKIRQEIRVLSEDAVLGESSRVESRGSCEETTHC